MWVALITNRLDPAMVEYISRPTIDNGSFLTPSSAGQRFKDDDDDNDNEYDGSDK